MLFSCCFKQTTQEQPEEERGLKESLLSKENKNKTGLAAAPVPQDKESLDLGQSVKEQAVKVQEIKPASLNNNLQKMKVIESYSTVHRYEQDVEQEQDSLKINPTRSQIKVASHQQFDKTKRQSDLWLQSGNKILYFVSQKDQEMVMTYKISHHKIESQLFDYVLRHHRFSHNFKNKPIDFSLCLVISSQSLSKLKALVANIIPDHHMRPIFGIFKKQNEQKSLKNHYEVDFYIHDIIIIGNNCLRLQAFQRIIIILNSQKDFSTIMAYCQKITQQFQLEEISKISFVFPAFLTLSEVNTILSKINRKFLISEVLQKTISHLGFYVQLFEHANVQEAIIVSSIQNIYKQDEKINKKFEIKLQLAIGLLMVQINHNNAQLYSTLISNFLMDKTINEYLKFIDFLHKDKKEFINKLQALKLFDSSQLQEIQKSRKMQEKIISPNQKTITIKYSHKRRLGQFFQEYHTTKTPIEQSQCKKEWDDDLRQYDISATIIEKQPKQIESNCNIFQVIDDSYVDKADLGILPDDYEIQFQEDD